MATYKVETVDTDRFGEFTIAPTKGESKMSKANQTGTATVVKTESEYMGIILKSSSRGLWHRGQAIWSTKLERFTEGVVLNVTCMFTESEELIAQKAVIKTVSDSEIDKEVFLDALLPPLIAADMSKVELPDEAFITPGDLSERDVVMGTTKMAVRMKEAPSATAAASAYYISPDARLVLNTAVQMSRSKPATAVRVMMVGPSGFGKTTIPEVLANRIGKTFYRMNCGAVRDPEEWFGYREAREGNTVFIRSEFMKVVEAGNCVVVLDEFNRLEPWLHNTLFPLLDHAGKTTVHDEEFRIGEGVIICGTINTGYKYTGTFELDEALLNRFEFILEVGPMPHENEVNMLLARCPDIDRATASSIVKACNTLRQQEVSCPTRSSLRIAEKVVSGMTIREAFEFEVIKKIPQDSSGTSLRKQVIETLNVQLKEHYKPRAILNDIFDEAGTAGEKAEDKKTSFRLHLTLNPSVMLLNIQTLNYLRQLNLVDGTQFSLSEAKAIVTDLEEGKNIVILLANALSDTALADFESAGIHATCEVN